MWNKKQIFKIKKLDQPVLGAGVMNGGSIQLLATANDILTDPPKYNKYQQDLAKYALERKTHIWRWGNIGAIFINTWFRTYF